MISAAANPPHDPDLYRPAAVEPVAVETFADIDGAAEALYHEHGYLVVRRAFDASAVAAGVAGLRACIMGEIPGFDGIEFEAAAQPHLATMTFEERQDAVRKLMRFNDHEPRLRAFSEAPALLAAVRRLLGGREPHMFQDMAMLKPPLLGREKPWHQDHAYFDYPVGTPIVGVWIALDHATVENGCMQFLPGGHRQGPVVHFKRRDWQICDTHILGQQSVATPLEPGGLVLFDGLLPHGTPHNNSRQRRRAVQFHYGPADAVKTSPEERLAIFGSEGRDVSC